MTDQIPNEFQSNLYRSRDEMVAAIAYEYLTGGGANNSAFIAEALREATDEQLAAECIEGWGLSETGDSYDDYDDSEPQSHMQFNGYDAADLVEAFAELRKKAIA